MARRADRLEAVAAGLDEALVVPADITRPDEVERLAAVVIESVSATSTCWSTTPASRDMIAAEDEALETFRADG